MIDVFVGPAGSDGDYVFTRWFPTHFVTLWMVDTPSHHAGRLGDLGLASVWMVGALAVAGAVVAAGSRTARRRQRTAGQLPTALRFGLVDLRRNGVLLVLLVIVPAAFVLLAKVTTPGRSLMVSVTENGSTSSQSFWFPEVHAGAMAPIGIGALAALVGMFVVVDAASGDRRLRLAGYRTGVVLAARLGVVAVAAIVITAATMAVTATVFDAQQWPGYIGANLLIAAIYALIGVVIGPLLGKVAGVFVAFLIPFLDLGIIQSPMLRPEPSESPWICLTAKGISIPGCTSSARASKPDTICGALPETLSRNSVNDGQLLPCPQRGACMWHPSRIDRLVEVMTPDDGGWWEDSAVAVRRSCRCPSRYPSRYRGSPRQATRSCSVAWARASLRSPAATPTEWTGYGMRWRPDLPRSRT